MSLPVAMLYVVIEMSPEVAKSSLDIRDIFRLHADKAIRSIPERVYAIDRRKVMGVALPPWEVYDVKQGGDHADPLAMDRYSIRLISRNVEPVLGPEAVFAQRMLDNIPEGAMLTSDYALFMGRVPDDPTRSDSTYLRGADILALYESAVARFRRQNP